MKAGMRKVRTISEGATTEVTLMRHRRREVVVKRLLPHLQSSPTFRERLNREGEIADRLDHPNIVKLIERADHYLVFEYVAGRDLAAILEAGPLSAPEAAAIVRQVLLALDHAHGRGVIHLDVKPDNVLVTPDGVVKLTDFGIAKGLDLEAITLAGVRLGTPYYMSPEQYQGERGDLRSDLYSAGVVLFECLAGEPPYTGDIFRVLGDLQTSPLPQLDAPDELIAVIRRALRKRPRDRYQSAREMLAELAGAVSAQPAGGGAR
jgi:serine/threonine-protein kinase